MGILRELQALRGAAAKVQGREAKDTT